MNIKNRLRELLMESKNRKNEFGCVMVSLSFSDNKFEDILKLIDKEDLYVDPEDPSFGLETKPHVTALFGLHSSIKDEEIEEVLVDQKKPKIVFSDVSTFTADKYDVLKFDVKSEDMGNFNTKLKEFPFTSDFPDYHPHCTIAYLKKATAEKYIKKIKKLIDGLGVKPKNIVYSKTDGSEKEYDFK